MKCKWHEEHAGKCRNTACCYYNKICPLTEHQEECRRAEATPEKLTISELISALRHCAKNSSCVNCAAYKLGSRNCMREIKTQSADVLEKTAKGAVPMDFHERCLALEIQKRRELEEKQQWIRTENQRPSEGMDVLMLFEHNMAVGFLRDKNEPLSWSSYVDDGFYTDCNSEPICWMPLPEFQKEDESHD